MSEGYTGDDARERDWDREISVEEDRWTEIADRAYDEYRRDSDLDLDREFTDAERTEGVVKFARTMQQMWGPRLDSWVGCLEKEVINLSEQLEAAQESLAWRSDWHPDEIQKVIDERDALQAAGRKFLATGNEIDLANLITPGEYLVDLIPHQWEE